MGEQEGQINFETMMDATGMAICYCSNCKGMTVFDLSIDSCKKCGKRKEISIEKQLESVHIIRLTLIDLKNKIAELKEVWEKEHEGILKMYKSYENALPEAEQRLRNMAISIFNETQNKKPCPGVEVKLFETLSYDPEVALNWVLDKKLPACLQLDKKMFEKVAGALKPDFVGITEEAKATIATDLGKVLGEK